MTDTESHAPVLTVTREEYDNEFTYAVRCQDIAKLKELLEENPNYLSQSVIRDKYALPPIYIAASKNCLPVVKFLIESGADVNQPQQLIKKYRGRIRLYDDDTPLMVASILGHIEIVKLLIKHGAEVNKHNINKETPLYNACVRMWMHDSKFEIVRILCENGANIEMITKDGENALSLAVEGQRIDVVQYLLDQGANPNNSGTLRTAACLNLTHIAKLLLERGADPNRTSWGHAPLFEAVSNNNLLLVRMLLQYGATPNVKNPSGASAIYLATVHREIEIMKDLLEAGAVVDELAKMHAYTPAIKELLGIPLDRF